ncbi:MAG: tetratricopeptide repeat protein [Bacteroidota bacterium]
MKSSIFLIAGLLLFVQTSFACSMYKITHNGKTIVGNNEDWFSPNTQMWFTPGKDGLYGVMNVGFTNGFPQGGINEAGLMYDGFAMPYLAVTQTSGKKKMPLGEAINSALQAYATVQEVKAYLLTVDLSDLAYGMVVFIDRKGDYLVVEGDEINIGQEAEQSFSNFYPSQTSSREAVDISFYQNGLSFINQSEAESSFNYCASVMNKMQQDITQYSTIYDLDALTIRIYHYHNFENYKEINLKEALKKGEHTLAIPDLFPDNTEGQTYYQLYNDAKNPTRIFSNMVEDAQKDRTEQEMEEYKQGLTGLINQVGYEWLNATENTDAAIAVFKYGTELAPDNANLFDSLGEAYFRKKEYAAAKKHYHKSLALNPDNSNAKEMLKKIEEEE